LNLKAGGRGFCAVALTPSSAVGPFGAALAAFENEGRRFSAQFGSHGSLAPLRGGRDRRGTRG